MRDTFVFVYGTLKSGYGNNRLLSEATFVDTAVTNNEYYLTNVGFPYMIRPENLTQDFKTLPVVGEVWKVNEEELRDLDRLEGVPTHYERVNVNVTLSSGEVIDCLGYSPAGDIGQESHPCQIITGNGQEYYQWSR